MANYVTNSTDFGWKEIEKNARESVNFFKATENPPFGENIWDPSMQNSCNLG